MLSKLRELVEANFTLITVTTDDTHIFGDVLLHTLGPDIKITASTAAAEKSKDAQVFYQVTSEITNDRLRKLSTDKKTLIIANYTGDLPSVYHYGPLETPTAMIVAHFLKGQSKKVVEVISKAIQGLSYTKSKQLIRLAKVRNTPITLKDYKALRQELYGASEGLYTVEDSGDVYVPDPKLGAWLEVNQGFMFGSMEGLTPRGLLLDGVGGTGKTQFAKHLSRIFTVPLFRLDMGGSMSRWQGESEENVRRHLQEVETNAPCVLLLDEVEKALTVSENDASSSRILAYLLWWLAEHTSQVFTVMTTNDISKLPKELYRPGRCDAVFLLEPMVELSAKKAIIHSWVLDWYDAGDMVDNDDAEFLYSALCKDIPEQPMTPAEVVNYCKSSLRSFIASGLVLMA